MTQTDTAPPQDARTRPASGSPRPPAPQSDAPPRSWNDTKLEALQDDLQHVGISRDDLGAGPDSPEFASVRPRLQEHPQLLSTLVTTAIQRPVPETTETALRTNARKGARAGQFRKAGESAVKRENHKGRVALDNKRLTYIGLGLLAIAGAAWAFWPASSQPAVAAAGDAASTSPSTASQAAGSAGGSTIAGTTASAPSTAGAGGTEPPVTPSAAAAGGAGAGQTLPGQASGVPPQPVATAVTLRPASQIAPPAQVTYASPPGSAQVASIPAPIRAGAAGRTGAGSVGGGASSSAGQPVTLTRLPPDAVNYGTPKLLELQAPAAKSSGVVTQSADAGSSGQGAQGSGVKSGAVTQSAAGAPAANRVVSQGAAVPTATGALYQSAAGQDAAGQSAAGIVTRSQDAASAQGQSGTGSLVSLSPQQGQGAATASSSSTGLVSLGRQEQQAGDNGAASGALVSVARSNTSGPSSSSGGLVSGSSTQAGNAAAGGATVMGGGGNAAQLAAPAAAYALGQSIKATLSTGALFATTEGDGSQGGSGVLQGQDQQRVYATAEDGSVWRGTPHLLSGGRVGITFDKVRMPSGAVEAVTADATDDSGLPGIPAQSHVDTPKAASELFAAALSGVRSFAATSLQGDTTVTSNGTIVTGQAKPNFWVTVGGALAGSLSLPTPRITRVDVTSVSKGTPVILVIRGDN